MQKKREKSAKVHGGMECDSTGCRKIFHAQRSFALENHPDAERLANIKRAGPHRARKLRIESGLKSKARRVDLRIGRLGKDETRAANLAIWRAERESKSAVSKEARSEILHSLKFYEILP